MRFLINGEVAALGFGDSDRKKGHLASVNVSFDPQVRRPTFLKK